MPAVVAGGRSGVLEGLQAVSVPWVYLDTPQAVAEAVAALRDGPIGFDLETTGLDPLTDRARLMQLSDGQRVLVVDLWATGGLAAWSDLLRGLRLVAHNAVFEMGFLRAAGIQHTVDCSMIGEHIASGGQGSLGLDAVIERRYGVVLDKATDLRTGWDGDLSDEKLAYAAADAYWCRQAWVDQQATISENKSQRAYAVVRDTQPAVVAMYANGVGFDRQGAVTILDDIAHRRGELEAVLSASMPGVNLRSPAQIGQWLTQRMSAEALEKWPKTNKGALMTGAAELEANVGLLSGDTAAVLREALIPYQALDRNQTRVRDYLDRVGADGRIHPQLTLTAAVTGRMSCRSPNLQAVPREAEIRRLFCAAPGTRLVLCDFGAIELRVAAHVVGAKGLLQAFEAGVDPHKQTASMLFNKPLEAVVPADRKVAKGCNFGLLYGQSAAGLRDYIEGLTGINLTLEEATQHRKRWFESYPEFASWQKEYTAGTKRKLMARTVCGRERRWDTVGNWKATQALNLPVQGTAAEVMQIALAQIHAGLEGMQTRLALVVHDEVLLEAPPDEVEAVKTLVRDAMVAGMREVFPDATDNGLADPEDGDSWADKG
jgi:DNA polymerase-1